MILKFSSISLHGHLEKNNPHMKGISHAYNLWRMNVRFWSFAEAQRAAHRGGFSLSAGGLLLAVC